MADASRMCSTRVGIILDISNSTYMLETVLSKSKSKPSTTDVPKGRTADAL